MIFAGGLSHTETEVLDAIVGQAAAVRSLKGALAAHAVHHAYLFIGQVGSGKAEAAIAFLQALFCPVAPDKGCGRCPSCARIHAKGHPDVTWVIAEPPSKDVRIDQIRELQARLSLRPLEGKRKAAVLPSAEGMTQQAQNALLKTLEEPPPDTVLILTSSAPGALLPTLKSRCAKIPFRAVRGKVDRPSADQRAEIVRRFEAIDPEDSRTILRFAEDFGGSREEAQGAFDALLTHLRDRAAAGPTAQSARAHRGFELLSEALLAVTEKNASPRLQLERALILWRA